MRIRLLIDVMMMEDEIPKLAELLVDQPGTNVKIEGRPVVYGRFMGATPVYEPENYGSQGAKATPEAGSQAT
jgi:hypothetical protein